MEEVSSLGRSVSSLWERIPQRLNLRVRSFRLLQRSRWVRKMVDMAIMGIEVEPIPPYLGEDQRAILVTNYPSVSEGLRALLKAGCRLPGETFRVKAIGRNEVVVGANLLLRVLGVDQLIFPALKDQSGKYVLEPGVLKSVLGYLEGPGNLLGLSITGNPRGNGLLERDVRTGAAAFSLKKKIPLVPMGLVAEEKRGKIKVVKIRFGEPINPPEVGQLAELEMGDVLLDISRLAMCQIAALLPPGQRGDFEDVEDRLMDVTSRLSQQSGPVTAKAEDE